MSREDLDLQRASPEPSTSSHHHETASSYSEEDHRRLLFGLMRSGLTPQVELALRLIDEASHSSRSRTHSRAPSTSSSNEVEEEYDSEEDLDSEDYAYSSTNDEDEDEQDLSVGDDDEENSPALTTKPLGKNNSFIPAASSSASPGANHKAEVGRGLKPRAWGYSKSDDQQPSMRSFGGGHPHVERWLADMHGGSGVVV